MDINLLANALMSVRIYVLIYYNLEFWIVSSKSICQESCSKGFGWITYDQSWISTLSDRDSIFFNSEILLQYISFSISLIITFTRDI